MAYRKLRQRKFEVFFLVFTMYLLNLKRVTASVNNHISLSTMTFNVVSN